MIEDSDAKPKLGRSGRMLGVRLGGMPYFDIQAINPNDIVSPGGGGVSVAPDDPMLLPRHRRPPSLGGIGRDTVWSIDTSDLGSDLVFRQDRADHGLIEPAYAMDLQTFEEKLALTRPQWFLYCR